MTLVEFLLARITEDEETAFGGASSPWREGLWDGDHEGYREVLDRHGERTAVCYYGGTYGHVLRFDPTRVLAECEAKRRILDEHQASRLHPDQIAIGSAERCCVCAIGPYVMHRWPCPTLRVLALPYAAHPDYRKDWRP